MASVTEIGGSRKGMKVFSSLSGYSDCTNPDDKYEFDERTKFVIVNKATTEQKF